MVPEELNLLNGKPLCQHSDKISADLRKALALATKL